MDCPKCGLIMEKLEYMSIVIDRCTGCKGIWFDLCEEEHLKNLNAAKIFDTGDAKIGKEWNRETEIICPICHYPMVSREDEIRPHIEFEWCPKCNGIFFDAGEFKEFEQRTFLETLRDILGKKL